PRTRLRRPRRRQRQEAETPAAGVPPGPQHQRLPRRLPPLGRGRQAGGGRLAVPRPAVGRTGGDERRATMTATTPLPQRPAWKALEAHARQVRGLQLRRLFADDPKRGQRLTAEAVGIYLDYSKNRVTDETLQLLLRLAEECGLRERIDALFRGD